MNSSILFNMILAIFTIITGIFWIFNKFTNLIINNFFLKKRCVINIDEFNDKIVHNFNKIPKLIKSISYPPHFFGLKTPFFQQKNQIITLFTPKKAKFSKGRNW